MYILFCDHNSICEVGIIRALIALEHKVTLVNERWYNPEHDAIYENKLEQKMESDKWDIVFSVNFVPIISRVCSKKNIPYVCWIVDSPVIQLYSETLLNACNYVFIFDYTLYAEFVDRSPGHLFWFPLGCDFDLYEQIDVTKEDHEKYDSDLSFVGSLYSEKCVYNSIEKRLPDYVQGYFAGILNAQKMIYGYNFLREVLSEQIIDILKEHISINQSADYQIDERVLFGNILLNPKCTEMERIYLLNSLVHRLLFSYTL